jgi:hypothetical protein
LCADFLAKNEDEAARAAVAEEKATEVAKNQIVAKSKMSKAEKEKLKKDKAKARCGMMARPYFWRWLCHPG